MKLQPRIAVIGSVNIDLVTYTDEFPRPGETIFGREFSLGFGGKGANQAVAARLCSAEGAMVARVGDDRVIEGGGADFRGELGAESDLGGEGRQRPALARRCGRGGHGTGGRGL